MRNTFANSSIAAVVLFTAFCYLLYAFPQLQDWRATQMCKARPACVSEIKRLTKGTNATE